jgi:cytochrome c-type biogenesis protein CcmF
MDIPAFGTLVLCAVLVMASFTFALALGATRNRPHFLAAARHATLATCGLVVVAVLVLAYAFQTHDFRIRYVARYSDRSMPWWYLVTSLWGGQDGSLLWWAFLLSLYTGVCVAWMKRRYLELQPVVLATLMSIMMFFAVLMLFAANPFATTFTAAPVDGEGLNPLLQNYWMTIHPPSLYMGFVGWSVPFAFVIAALVTGRLGEEWIYATRRWVLVAWGFLSVGNLLGALWSYEELGWGGYWAWDPVENAAFMPWLSGTAYLHSIMIQERRGMMKVWNVFLLCLTFIMTIFGTFLTRSGLIASVHSFARSDIGKYFVAYLVVLTLTCFALIFWRLPKLRAQHKLDSLLSREFAFLSNNWILIGMQFFILLATTFPLISEALRGETVTVGPSYYNKWMVPLGLVLLLLTGIGPLMAWRKSTGNNLKQAFRRPALAGMVMLGLHIVVGPKIGYPPVVQSDAIYDTMTGKVLAVLYSAMPAVSLMLCTFVLGTVVQEFWRGTAVRRKNAGEPIIIALIRMVGKAKRRYGGYLVHVGIVSMFFGFTGAAYDREQEAALRPGERIAVAGYALRFDRSRMQVDPNKRMVFADMTLMRGDTALARVSPAKFIYRTHPEMPTTEVAIHSRLLEDVYVIMNSVNPESRVGTFKVIIRPLVSFIWLGGLMLLCGMLIAVSPSIRELVGDASVDASVQVPRAALAALMVSMTLLGASIASGLSDVPVAHAQADSSSSLHAGTVTLKSPEERKVFERLLCQCGDCARLPLSTCVCGWAERKRDEIRQDLGRGASVQEITEAYRAEFGPKSIAIPSDKGLDRALWAVPIVLLVVAGAGLVWAGKRWMRRGALAVESGVAAHDTADADTVEPAALRQRYDQKLEDELNRLPAEPGPSGQPGESGGMS